MFLLRSVFGFWLLGVAAYGAGKWNTGGWGARFQTIAGAVCGHAILLDALT